MAVRRSRTGLWREVPYRGLAARPRGGRQVGFDVKVLSPALAFGFGQRRVSELQSGVQQAANLSWPCVRGD